MTDAVHSLQGLLTAATNASQSPLSASHCNLETMLTRTSRLAVPRDQESAKAAVAGGYKELETRMGALTTAVKEAPAHVQSSVMPLVDGLIERLNHVKDELLKPDTPIADKGKNVLSYTQSQIQPLLASIADTLTSKKQDAEGAAKDTANQANAKINGGN